MADSVNPYEPEQLLILKLQLFKHFHLLFLTVPASCDQGDYAFSIKAFVSQLLWTLYLLDLIVDQSVLVHF